MIDPDALERQRQANRTLSQIVQQELEQFYRSLNLATPEAARDALLAYVPGLILKYGPISEQLAMEYYDELRLASGAAGSFRAAALPNSVMNEIAEAGVGSVRYAAGHLFRDNPKAEYDPEITLARLQTKMDKFVKEPGRQTMIFNAGREDVRWARVPKGDETCSFCLILASRGAEYLTEKSGGSKEYGEENLFHGFCDCEVIRVGQFEEYPEGYIPDDIYNIYYESAKRVGTNDLKRLLYDFRRRNADMVTDGVIDDEYLSSMG